MAVVQHLCRQLVLALLFRKHLFLFLQFLTLLESEVVSEGEVPLLCEFSLSLVLLDQELRLDFAFALQDLFLFVLALLPLRSDLVLVCFNKTVFTFYHPRDIVCLQFSLWKGAD